AVGATYQIGFWTAAGATPGKMLMKLKVVDEHGDQVKIDKAILRYVGYWVSTLTLLIGYLMIAFRKDKRGLHDLIAGTRVIRTE
ncbi:MAG TPA: RDD family protein, partial [Dehalococcoidia bacterium]